MNELNHLDIFTGIGGFALGFESEGFQSVGFAETDPDASLVLDHWFAGVPNLGNVRQIVRNEVGRVDVLTGGPPCQPTSLLGRRRGTSDERWLWGETIRLTDLFRPRYAVFENPPALLTLERGEAVNGIISGFHAIGYDCLWLPVPAAALGAGHRRTRIFIVCADANGSANRKRNVGSNQGQGETEHARENGQSPVGRFSNHSLQDAVGVAPNAHRSRLQGHLGDGEGRGGRTEARRPVAAADLRGRVACEEWWHEAHTGIPVLAHGISSKLAEAISRCSGNAIVPQVARVFARAIRLNFERQ